MTELRLEEEIVRTHCDFKGERCPHCHRSRLRFRRKAMSPLWLQRYGAVQLYVCDGCKKRFVVQDVSLEPIRRCQFCAEFFIVTRPNQRCCSDEHAEKHLRQTIDERNETNRLKEKLKNAAQEISDTEADELCADLYKSVGDGPD